MRTYQQVYDSGCPERGKLSMRVMVAEEVEDLDVVAQMLRDHTPSKVCPVTGTIVHQGSPGKGDA